MCWSMTYIQMCGYFIHFYEAIFLHGGFNCCNGLCCHLSVCLTRSRRVCYRTNAVHEFLVHTYTSCSDRHASPYWTFIRSWISMGFTLHHKKRMTERCSSLAHVASGALFLQYYCAVVLHSCIVLPPVGHSSIHKYYCCQLTRQSSCISNFYRTFSIFIWISLVLKHFKALSEYSACTKFIFILLWWRFLLLLITVFARKMLWEENELSRSVEGSAGATGVSSLHAVHAATHHVMWQRTQHL